MLILINICSFRYLPHIVQSTQVVLALFSVGGTGEKFNTIWFIMFYKLNGIVIDICHWTLGYCIYTQLKDMLIFKQNALGSEVG